MRARLALVIACGALMLGVFAGPAAGYGSPPKTLTVTTGGSGSGVVRGRPAGITCPTDCTENYATGTVVHLRAVPAAGSTFTGWSGACSGTGACSVTMDASKTVTATFG
jgi:uncharacterized repeat protein (TIGR02543 family)